MVDCRKEVEGEVGSFLLVRFEETSGCEEACWRRVGEAGRPFSARDGRERVRVELMY